MSPPIMLSYWQFNPEEDLPSEEPEVTAMPSKVEIERSDEGLLMMTIRGKPGKRYEKHDSAWLEIEDAQALRLIERLAGALGEEYQ